MPRDNNPSTGICSACGCAGLGNCGALISLLREEVRGSQHAAAAHKQESAAVIASLRRAAAEAEERARRVESKLAALQLEADALRERLATGAGDGGTTAGRDENNNDKAPRVLGGKEPEAQSAARAAEAAVDDVQVAGREAAERDADAAASGAQAEREAFRSLCSAHDDPETNKLHKTWTFGAFLDSLGVGAAVADVLLARLRATPGGATPAAERAFARQLRDHASRATVLALLREAPLAERLADLVWRGAEEFDPANRRDVDVAPLPAIAADGAATFSLGAQALHRGLDALLDAAEPWQAQPTRDPMKQLQREHCDEGDSRQHFTSPEHGISTTPENEYWYVVAPEKGLRHLGLSSWPEEAMHQATDRAGAQHASLRRRPVPLRELESEFGACNDRLAERHAPPLLREELVAARLFTGPMRCKYQTSLRSLSGDAPGAAAAHAHLCGTNLYGTTLRLLNRALLKLSSLASPSVLYRSVAGGVTPSVFWQPAHHRESVCAAVESGVLSCVREAAGALHLASQGARGGMQSTVLCIREGIGDCAASLCWLSQYPEERELAFPPLTGLTVLSSRVAGGALLLDVQPSVPRAGADEVDPRRDPAPTAQAATKTRAASGGSGIQPVR